MLSRVSNKQKKKEIGNNKMGFNSIYGNYKSQHGASVVLYKIHHKFITVSLKKTIKGNYNKRNNKEKICLKKKKLQNIRNYNKT